MTPLLLALSLVLPATASHAADTLAPGVGPLVPDTVITPPGGPRVVMFGTEGDGVAALRLFVPLQEGPTEQGSGEILRSLALARIEGLARRVGAWVSGTRTPWGLAYEVEGSAADFGYLAYLLRLAVAAPDTAQASLDAARAHLRAIQDRATETPDGRVAAELRAAVSPDTPPPEGTPQVLDQLDGRRIEAVWRRSHQASGMTLVVSSPLVPEAVLAATRGMGAPPEDSAGPPQTPVRSRRSRVRVQTLRAWYALAYEAGGTRDPVAEVAARLVASGLRHRSAGYQTDVELWDLPGRSVLVLTGAAYPRGAAAMRRAVSGTVQAVRQGLDASAVRSAASAARFDILDAARTARGLVEVVGRSLEPDGNPDAAARHVEALARVRLPAVEALLEQMMKRGPVRTEVRP